MERWGGYVCTARQRIALDGPGPTAVRENEERTSEELEAEMEQAIQQRKEVQERRKEQDRRKEEQGMGGMNEHVAAAAGGGNGNGKGKGKSKGTRVKYKK